MDLSTSVINVLTEQLAKEDETMNARKKLIWDLYSDSDVFHKLVVEIHNSSCQTLEHIPLEVAMQAMQQVWESCHKTTDKGCTGDFEREM